MTSARPARRCFLGTAAAAAGLVTAAQPEPASRRPNILLESSHKQRCLRPWTLRRHPHAQLIYNALWQIPMILERDYLPLPIPPPPRS